MTLREALHFAGRYLSERQLRQPEQDAEVLLCLVLGTSRAFLHAHPEQSLSPPQERLFHHWLVRRGEHYPLQYLRGKQEFYGRDFLIRPGVFIPRPETELVLEQSLEFLRGLDHPAPLAIDVGCGSGCIAVSLACQEPRLHVTAVDIAPLALKVARANAEAHGCTARLSLCQGQSLRAFRAASVKIHLIVSNPPYIGRTERDRVDPGVRRYEPEAALFAGRQGEQVYRELFQQAAGLLHPAGRLIVELSGRRPDRIIRLGRENGWHCCQVHRDLSGIDRCAIFQERARSAVL